MMRRAYILVTLMASVSAIDMAKRGMMLRGKSAEPQEIDRSKCSTICRKRTKLTCAWGKDLAINTEDKSYWCCDHECPTDPKAANYGTHKVTARDGLTYCCNVDTIKSDTHVRRFQGKNLELAVDTVIAAKNSIDDLESSFYIKSKEINELEAVKKLQNELMKEAVSSKLATDTMIQKEETSLNNKADTQATEANTLENTKLALQEKKDLIEVKKKNLASDLEEKEAQEEMKSELAYQKASEIEEKVQTIESQKNSRKTLISKYKSQLTRTSIESESLVKTIGTLTQELSRAKQYTQTCLLKQKGKEGSEAKQKQTADIVKNAAGQKQQEELQQLSEEFAQSQNEVQAKIDEIAMKKKEFETLMQEMSQSDGFLRSTAYQSKQNEMQATLDKIAKAEEQMLKQKREMELAKQKVEENVKNLHLADNSVGATPESGPVSVRFRAMAKKIREKVMDIDEKCGAESFTKYKALVQKKALRIVGCTDTGNCESWGPKLAESFNGIKSLTECMKAEYDELCTLMTKFKSMRAPLIAEINLMRQNTKKTSLEASEALDTFLTKKAKMISSFKTGQIQIAALRDDMEQFQSDYEVLTVDVKNLETQITNLNNQIKALDDTIETQTRYIQQYETEIANMRKEMDAIKIVEEQKIRLVIDATDRYRLQVKNLKSSVESQKIEMRTAVSALYGEDSQAVSCDAYKALECTELTKKEDCQSKNAAQFCVWSEGMAGETSIDVGCSWIDENSQQAIFLKKLMSGDLTAAYGALDSAVDSATASGDESTSMMDSLIASLKAIKEEPPVIQLSALCSRTEGNSNCKEISSSPPTYEFTTISFAVFDMNNFGCDAKDICGEEILTSSWRDKIGSTTPDGSATDNFECVPENTQLKSFPKDLVVSHIHKSFDGKSVLSGRRTRPLQLISCRNYCGEDAECLNKREPYNKWANEQIEAAKKEASATEPIPAWATNDNAGCLDFQNWGTSLKAVSEMLEIMKIAVSGAEDMKCAIRGVYASDTKRGSLCQNTPVCFEHKAARCRSEYILNMAKAASAMGDEFDTKIRPNICFSKPTEYSKIPKIQMQCGTQVCQNQEEAVSELQWSNGVQPAPVEVMSPQSVSSPDENAVVSSDSKKPFDEATVTKSCNSWCEKKISGMCKMHHKYKRDEDEDLKSKYTEFCTSCCMGNGPHCVATTKQKIQSFSGEDKCMASSLS